MTAALAAVVAAALTLGGSERLAAAQSEPQTVGDVTGFTASVEGQADGSVHLTWNAADNAQVYFVVYIKSTDLVAGNYGSVQMRPFNGTEGTIDGLDGGAPYSFTVTGMRWNWINYGTVWGNFTAWQHATPSGTATSPASGDARSEPETVGDVTGFAASVEGQPNGSVHLAWNAADNAQVYFVVYIKSTDLVAGNYGSVQMRPFNGTEGMIDGLDGGVPYSFTVTGMRWNWINYGTVWGSFAVWQHATPSGVAALPSIAFSDLENGAWLEQNRPALANQLKALPWFADGVENAELEAAEALIAAAVWFPNVFHSLMQMPWLGDGVTGDESIAIVYTRWAVRYDPQLANEMLQKLWLQDAISADEAQVIRNLYWIMRLHDSEISQQKIPAADVENLKLRLSAAALSILAMPFLDQVDGADAAAVGSLERYSGLSNRDFLDVMSHPRLSDSITDEEAKIVALLGGTYQFNPELVSVLLDPALVTIEERSISLPRSGEMDLAIIRTAPGAARSMDLLEHSVRSIEEFMGAPFPTNYIVALFEEATAESTAAGTYFGTHIAMLPRYDVDDGSHEANFLPSLTAHEVAHYYWHGSEDWIDEGGATFMEFAVEKARVGRGLIADRYPCGYVSSIAEVVALDPEQLSPADVCNYSLGERIFLDLYRNLGEAIFRQGFSSLYQMRQVLDEYLWPTYLDISHVRNAFRPIAPAATAIINRWYDGPTPRGIAPPDSGPVDSSLPAINGRIEEAFVAFYQDGQEGVGSPVTRFSAAGVGDRWLFVYLGFTFPSTAEPKVQPLEYVQYYEDGFAFGQRERVHTFEPSWTGAGSGTSVGFPPGRKWATGRYWVYVYDGDRKVAEVTYEVVP